MRQVEGMVKRFKGLTQRPCDLEFEQLRILPGECMARG